MSDETGKVLSRASRALAGRSRETITGQPALIQRPAVANIEENSGSPGRDGTQRRLGAATRIARQRAIQSSSAGRAPVHYNGGFERGGWEGVGRRGGNSMFICDLLPYFGTISGVRYDFRYPARNYLVWYGIFEFVRIPSSHMNNNSLFLVTNYIVEFQSTQGRVGSFFLCVCVLWN